MGTLRLAERERCRGISLIRIIHIHLILLIFLILLILLFTSLLCLLQEKAEQGKSRRPHPSPYPPHLPSSLALEPVSLNSLRVTSFAGLSNAIRRANLLKVTVHVQLRSNIAFERRLPALKAGAGIHITGSCTSRCTLDGKGMFPIFLINTTSTSSSWSRRIGMNTEAKISEGKTSSKVIDSAFLVSASYDLRAPACEVILENVVVRRAKGGVLHGRCSFTAWNSVFEDNAVDEDGGAVLTIPGDDGIPNDMWDLVLVYIHHCAFVRNTAFSGNGGAILSLYGVSGMWLDIAHSVFVGNSAKNGSGGAISSQNKDRIVLKNTSFEGNIANDSGGAIHIGGPYKSTFLCMDSIFSNNHALRGEGGAVAVFEFPCIQMFFCHTTFKGNHAAGIGGKGSSDRESNLGGTNINVEATTTDGNVAATAKVNDGEARGIHTETDEDMAVKKATIDSSDDVFMQERTGLYGMFGCGMEYSHLMFCPRVPHSGVRVFQHDAELDQISEDSNFGVENCEMCSGCVDDCNNHGLCQIDTDFHVRCECERGYDPSNGCDRCLPGFETLKAKDGSASSCLPCAGLDQIPNTLANKHYVSISSTIQPSLEACIAYFKGTPANTVAYFTRNARKECRHACVLVSKPWAEIGPCEFDGKLQFLPHHSMYYLEVVRSYVGCK